jgi:hypothetical protein
MDLGVALIIRVGSEDTGSLEPSGSLKLGRPFIGACEFVNPGYRRGPIPPLWLGWLPCGSVFRFPFLLQS